MGMLMPETCWVNKLDILSHPVGSLAYTIVWTIKHVHSTIKLRNPKTEGSETKMSRPILITTLILAQWLNNPERRHLKQTAAWPFYLQAANLQTQSATVSTSKKVFPSDSASCFIFPSFLPSFLHSIFLSYSISHNFISCLPSVSLPSTFHLYPYL
jgi:hypothetical protein